MKQELSAPSRGPWRRLFKDASQKCSIGLGKLSTAATTTMIVIDFPINTFNALKFIVLELLLSCVLEPVWELIISRTAHARVVRGEQVTLSSLPKSRTFPCALTTGRLSATAAAVLSLITLGGSLASEYAINSVLKTSESTDTALVYSRSVGRRSVESVDSMRDAADTAFVMASRCYYRDKTTGKFFVNGTFANSTGFVQDSCVSNNSSKQYRASDVCILTRTSAHSDICLWNSTSETFETSSSPEYNATGESSVLSEIRGGVGASTRNGSQSLVLHMCSGGGSCTRNTTFARVYSAQVYCDPSEPERFPQLTYRYGMTCLYVSDRWMFLTTFNTEEGTPLRGNHPMLVYSNVRGAGTFGNFTEFDFRILRFFRASFAEDLTFSSYFDIARRSEGIVLMLLLEGFARNADLQSIRDYRQDTTKLVTQVDERLFIPLLFATVVLVAGAIAAAVSQPKRDMVLQVPVSTQQLMSCARAREAGDDMSAFGHSQGTLRMGIMKDGEDGEKKQKFSVNAQYAVPYNPKVGLSGGRNE